MKREIIYEALFISGTLVVSLILFSIVEEEEIPYLAASEVVLVTFPFLYFFLCLLRQLWEKFGNLILNFSLIIVSVLLSILLFNFIELIKEPNVVFANNGITIYPPLSSFPDTLDNNSSLKENFVSGIYFFCIAIVSVIILTTIKSIRNLTKIKLP